MKTKIIATADLMDQYPDLWVAESIFKDFGAKKSFYGQIQTLKCFKDNSLVRQILSTDGRAKVLVIDGLANLQTALLGDLLAQLAIDHHWQGIVINGCIRDRDKLAQMPIGIKALAAIPKKSAKNNQGKIGSKLKFAGIEFKQNQYIYCDADGIVVSQEALH